MKIFTCMCCSAFFNMFFGMEPKEKPQQQTQNKKVTAYARYNSMEVDDLLGAMFWGDVRDHRTALRVVQEKFRVESEKIQKRLDHESKVNPNFETSLILIDPERLQQYQNDQETIMNSSDDLGCANLYCDDLEKKNE